MDTLYVKCILRVKNVPSISAAYVTHRTSHFVDPLHKFIMRTEASLRCIFKPSIKFTGKQDKTHHTTMKPE